MADSRRSETAGASSGITGHLPVSLADGEGEEDPVAADAVGGDDANWHPSNHTYLSPLWRKYVAQTLKIHSCECL